MKSTIIGEQPQVTQPTFETGQLVRGTATGNVVICSGSCTASVFSGQLLFIGQGATYGVNVGLYSNGWYKSDFELCPIPLTLRFEQ